MVTRKPRFGGVSFCSGRHGHVTQLESLSLAIVATVAYHFVLKVTPRGANPYWIGFEVSLGDGLSVERHTKVIKKYVLCRSLFFSRTVKSG